MDSTWRDDEETIRDEIKTRPRDIVIEEVRVRPSGKKLTWPQYQAAVENAYLQESQTVEGFSACEVELSCHRMLDHWDKLEVMSRMCRLYEAEEAGAEQHRRRLYEIRAELDESSSAMSYDEFAPWGTGSVTGLSRIRHYVGELKALIEHYDDCKEFFSSLVREAEEDRASWKEMAERLAVRWENDPSAVPWFSPRGLDVRRASFELLKITWPLLGWREGFVDQSELHILVRSGGTDLRPDEPEGIDIALVGPDENEQLIVEFLPMIGVDPEVGQDARDAGIGLIERTVDRGRRLGNPWQYAKHHCGTGANMYSLVRFVPRSGRSPTRNLKSETYTETEFVRKQLGRTEQVAPSEQLTFYEAYEAVAFRLERESGKIYGYLMQLTHDSVAMELSVPTRTGCMIRSIAAPYEDGYLIDAEGRLNDFGIQKLLELIEDMQTAVLAMEERIGDIQVAAHAVLERSKATDEPHDDDEYVMQIWEALPGPPIDVDVTFFCCIVDRWIWRNVHGLIAPEGWGKA